MRGKEKECECVCVARWLEEKRKIRQEVMEVFF